MWDHEPDPDGDVTLILHNPNAPFVVDVYEVSPPCSISSNELTPEDVPDMGHAPDAPVVESSNVDVVPELSAGPEPVAQPASLPQKQVRFRLSSRHLSLASPYFKAMLDGSWKESHDRVVSANDWDEEAMVVLMCIIHGRTRSVPKLISLDLLAKIAVLVDYYKCHEAVEFVVEAWIDKLEQPTEISRDLILWLLISWVFQRAEIFKGMTKIAVHQSRKRLMVSNLPLPKRISDMIYHLRMSLIREIISSLRLLEDDFLQGKTGCASPQECSAMLLGALYKGLHVAGLPYRDVMWIEGVSFEGVSFDGLMNMVSEIRTPTWMLGNGNHYSYHSCKVVTYIKGKIKIKDVDGFNLEDVDIPFSEGLPRRRRESETWRELEERLIIRK